MHFSDSAPLARAERDNWNDVQFYGLRLIRQMANRYKAQTFIAGDVFDKYKVSPATVNQALREFLEFDVPPLAVPGQHDLPYHNYEDIKGSSYWTLVQSSAVRNMKPKKWYLVADTLVVTGFPWNHKIDKPKIKTLYDGLVSVAVCHKYIWHKSAKYPDAPETASATFMAEQLAGFDLAFFGDNHKKFWTKVDTPAGPCQIVNCGGHAPRKADEKNYRPYIYVVTDKGYVEYIELPLQYKWENSVVEIQKHTDQDLDALAETLKAIGPQSVDFKEAMDRYLNSEAVPKSVRSMILEAMEKK